MQPLRSEYAASLDKNEARASRYGAFDFFKEDTKRTGGILDADTINNIKRSFGNSVVVPVLDGGDVTIGNVRSCAIADDENTSQLVTLTFVTYAFGFTMHTAQYTNNDIKYQTDFTRKLKKYLNKLAATLDTAAINKLEANKNAFWTSLTDYYPQTAGAMQITQAQKGDFYNKLQAIMETADFYGDIKVIKSTSGSPMVRRLSAQGAGNDENDSFQFGPYEWMWSNRIGNGAGVEATGYAVESGNVAFETRLDPDALAGHRIGDVSEWGVVNVPLPGSPNSIEMGTFYRKDCNDSSGISTGLTRTLKESFEWSMDAMYLTSYNRDTVNRYNPIVKFEITTA